jgi:hypothetical protein
MYETTPGAFDVFAVKNTCCPTLTVAWFGAIVTENTGDGETQFAFDEDVF